MEYEYHRFKAMVDNLGLSTGDAEGDWNTYDGQDHVVQVGQGRILQQANDHLGQVDLGVSLLRKVWACEPAKLAQNEPLKVWRPELITAQAERRIPAALPG